MYKTASRSLQYRGQPRLSDGAPHRSYEVVLRLLEQEAQMRIKSRVTTLVTLAIDALDYEIPSDFERRLRQVVTAVAKTAEQAELLPPGIFASAYAAGEALCRQMKFLSWTV